MQKRTHGNGGIIISTIEFEAIWKENDALSQVPKPGWAKRWLHMRKAFPSPYRPTTKDPLAEEIEKAIKRLDNLKPENPGPAYLGTEPTDLEGPNYAEAERAKLGDMLAEISDVVKESVGLFEGLPNWNHPLTMPNVIPPANIAAIIAAMMTEVFSPNIIEGEYSWKVAAAELESAAMLARLVGWDPYTSRGLYTFGGSGCYFYGLKYALTRVLGLQSRLTGIRTDAKILVSQQGHYCRENATDWSGLGMDNIVEVKTDIHTNAMDPKNLEEKLKAFHDQGIPVVSVICTMGTTDANAFDPVANVRELIDKYPNPAPYGKTFLYCDSVVGWSWLTFAKYNFAENPLNFKKKILSEIRRNYDAVKGMVYADAIGCDFHKVGWAPYNCSLFIYKDRVEFEYLMRRPGSQYLQERTSYNPGLYTLEVSRSGSYAMAGWATLKYFGYEGFQAVLGGILEMQHYLRQKIAQCEDIVCVNPDDYGLVTLFRVYPEGTKAQDQYNQELNRFEMMDELKRNNELQQKVADQLWNWFRNGDKHSEFGYAPYISYTSGFRPTEYNRDKKDPDAVIYALKSFPMNLNIDAKSMQTLIEMVRAARDEVSKS